MEVAKILVSENHATVQDLKMITSGTVGATVSFEFAETWDGFTKIYVFRAGGKTLDDTHATGIIPAALLEPGLRLEAGVYGTKGAVAIPTVWADLGVVRAGADPSGDESTDSSLPVWAQIREDMDKLLGQPGEGNRAVTFNDPANRAISEDAFAGGTGSMAGLKGFYWTAMEIQEGERVVLTLSTANGEFGEEQDFDVADFWVEGDTISFHNNQKYYGAGEIEEINGKTVKICYCAQTAALPQTDHFTDNAVYVLAKPDKGLVDFGQGAVAFGLGSKATNFGATAFGFWNNVYGQYGFAGGRNNRVGHASAAFGRENIVSGEQSFASGYKNSVTDNNSAAHGRENTVSGRYASAFGIKNVASGENSNAVGCNTTASQESAHAEGFNTTAKGFYSHAEGSGSTASGTSSHAEGNNTKASGYTSHAEGSGTKASASYSHAEGGTTEASGECSHAEGHNTEASGANSHAEGNYTAASGNSSHAEGDNTQAAGGMSHAEGYYSQASGTGAHAEGSYAGTMSSGNITPTKATGTASHAEGQGTLASGTGAHSEGVKTTASGGSSHAEGESSKATARACHAEGLETQAGKDDGTGAGAHAEGRGTIANSQAQHVQGKYNIKDTEDKYAHIIGNGTSDTKRSNAHTVDWKGNAWYAGTVEGTALILKSPNGTRFQITVDDDGVLAAAAI